MERCLEMGCFSRGNYVIKMLNGVKGTSIEGLNLPIVSLQFLL